MSPSDSSHYGQGPQPFDVAEWANGCARLKDLDFFHRFDCLEGLRLLCLFDQGRVGVVALGPADDCAGGR